VGRASPFLATASDIPWDERTTPAGFDEALASHDLIIIEAPAKRKFCC
jgi:hypothetical protein